MISALPFAPPEQLDQVHLKTNDRTWTNFWNLPCLYNKKHFWILTKSYFLTKFYNISQHSPALLTRSLQFWLDFSSIVHLFDQVFELLREKASQLKSAGHRQFSAELVEYAERQWRTGLFTKQDWNLFNINVLMVPATNNGNEVWCTCIYTFLSKNNGRKKTFDQHLFKTSGDQRKALHRLWAASQFLEVFAVLRSCLLESRNRYQGASLRIKFIQKYFISFPSPSFSPP